jgi:uncharacterized protein YehS (DUF1456 family)
MAETIDEMMARVTALQQPVNPSEFSGALGGIGSQELGMMAQSAPMGTDEQSMMEYLMRKVEEIKSGLKDSGSQDAMQNYMSNLRGQGQISNPELEAMMRSRQINQPMPPAQGQISNPELDAMMKSRGR